MFAINTDEIRFDNFRAYFALQLRWWKSFV